MHTLSLSGPGSITQTFYRPALDRERGTQLELLIDIPATSRLDLTYDFEKAVLRYTEYPPDANRGFDVAPAVIRVLSEGSTGGGQGEYLRTTSLLLPLPTPDFSMPYNVIILTSTVIALGFGSIFNLLVRRFVLVEEIPAGPLAGVVAKVKAAVGKLKGGKSSREEQSGKVDLGSGGGGPGEGKALQDGMKASLGNGVKNRKPLPAAVEEE